MLQPDSPWHNKLCHPAEVLSPVANATIPRQGWLSFGTQRTDTHVHQGVDIGAPAGTPVTSIAAGVVQHAVHSLRSGFSGYGKVVTVAGFDGLYYLYAHLDSVDVAEGQQLQVGQQLGTVGRTCFRRSDPQAKCGGNHLHFEVSSAPYPQHAEAPRLDPVARLTQLGASKSLQLGLVAAVALTAGLWYWRGRGR